MPRKTLTFTPRTIIAIMTLLNIAVPTYAKDVFPLDVWAEMEVWQRNRNTASTVSAESLKQPALVASEKTGTRNTHFPFDVLHEMNTMGGTRRPADKTVAGRYGQLTGKPTTALRRSNPYWLPAELDASAR